MIVIATRDCALERGFVNCPRALGELHHFQAPIPSAKISPQVFAVPNVLIPVVVPPAGQVNFSYSVHYTW